MVYISVDMNRRAILGIAQALPDSGFVAKAVRDSIGVMRLGRRVLKLPISCLFIDIIIRREHPKDIIQQEMNQQHNLYYRLLAIISVFRLDSLLPPPPGRGFAVQQKGMAMQ